MSLSHLSKAFQPNPKVSPLAIYIGFVKKNDDAQRMGRLMVYIPELGGVPDDPGCWILVSYASPFAGATNPDNIKESSQEMDGSQQSYGFWMVPPDLNNEVAVFFANGELTRGYWFACCYQHGMNHMIPGIATNITTEPTPPLKTGPVVEYNKANVGSVYNPRRPRFKPLSSGLDSEGLTKDNERGSSSTSARREAPSQVFGMLSPRGNTMHIDDDPENEFIRLRTRSGAQVLIHETTGYVYINSKNGNAWLEISDAGVDVYCANSISMRAEGDFNIRADKNIVFDAGANIYMKAGQQITLSAGTHVQVGAADKLVLSGKTGSLKLETSMAINTGTTLRMQSTGDTTMLAAGKQIRSGQTIFDNCDGAPQAAADAAAGPAPETALDTARTGNGEDRPWTAGGGEVRTIVGRMPTHEPWYGHPNSKVPPPPLEENTIDSQGTQGGGNGEEGRSSNPNEQGCSFGVAQTKPISTTNLNIINGAAAQTGVNPATMLAFGDRESGFDPSARAADHTPKGAVPTSAKGTFQFLDDTWTDTVNKYGHKYNVPNTPDAVFDPYYNAVMAGELMAENARYLKKNHGIDNPTAGQLYVMHFMGTTGGSRLIEAAAKDPNADASTLFKKQAASNPLFKGKTVGQVLNGLTSSMDAKAAAYASQHGLPAPCDRTSGTAAKIANPNIDFEKLKNANGRIGTNSECVALVKEINGLPNTAQWSPGERDLSKLAPGSPIATFDSNGKYGNHSDGTSHAAVFLGMTEDGKGIRVLDQYASQGGEAKMRVIPFNKAGSSVVGNAANYRAINLSTLTTAGR